MGRSDEAAQIAEVIARISAIYPDISTTDIERIVQTVHTGFDDANLLNPVVMVMSCQLRPAFHNPLVNQVDLEMQLVTEIVRLTVVSPVCHCDMAV